MFLKILEPCDFSRGRFSINYFILYHKKKQVTFKKVFRYFLTIGCHHVTHKTNYFNIKIKSIQFYKYINKNKLEKNIKFAII